MASLAKGDHRRRAGRRWRGGRVPLRRGRWPPASARPSSMLVAGGDGRGWVSRSTASLPKMGRRYGLARGEPLASPRASRWRWVSAVARWGAQRQLHLPIGDNYISPSGRSRSSGAAIPLRGGEGEIVATGERCTGVIPRPPWMALPLGSKISRWRPPRVAGPSLAERVAERLAPTTDSALGWPIYEARHGRGWAATAGGLDGAEELAQISFSTGPLARPPRMKR